MLFSYGMKPGKEVSFILPVTTPVWSTQSTNIPSERGLAIIPLQQIFLIAAVFDIQILPFWLPSEENIVNNDVDDEEATLYSKTLPR